MARLRLWRHVHNSAWALVGVVGVISGFFLVLDFGRESRSAGPPPAASTAGGPVPGEHYQWRHVAIGGGGFITGYDFDITGDVRVARTDVYGAYIWRPDQNRWEQLVSETSMPTGNRIQAGANEGVFEVVVAPSDKHRIYMALKGGVYRSANGGQTFTRVTPENTPFPLAFDPNSVFRQYGPFMAVSPTQPDLVFFGTPNNGLWRSEDGGHQWSKVGTVPDGADMRPAPGVQSPGIVIWFERVKGGAASGRIWAMSAGNGVFVSGDNGRTFMPLSDAKGLQPQTLMQGAFAPDGAFWGVDSESRTLWAYRHGGWENLTGRLGELRRPLVTVAINPLTSEIYVFDEGGKPFHSQDDGESWSGMSHRARVGDGDPPWLRVSDQSYFATASVRFDPAVANRLWVAAGTGVFYADVPPGSSQIRWISQSRGIEELVTNDVVQPSGRSPLFAAWDFGIHVKDDLNAFSTTYGPRERVVIAAQQMDWSAGHPDFIVTNASDTRMTCCSEDGDAVMAGYSEDAGRTWTKFSHLPQPPGTRADDPWRMSFGMIAVSSGDPSNIVWAPSFNRAPFYTKDKGVTWSRVVFPGEHLPNTGSHAAYYYNRKTLAADRVLPGVFYFVHSGTGQNEALKGVWKTGDGGDHWVKVFTGEVAPASQYSAKLRAVPGKAGHLFFTSAVKGVSDTRLRRSIDGGAHWSVVNGVDRVDDIVFGKTAKSAQYPTLFISGQVGGLYGIWRSVDEAKTWTRIAGFPAGTLDQVTVMGADPDVFGRVYIGYQGSGWIYGEPSGCVLRAQVAMGDSECLDVR